MDASSRIKPPSKYKQVRRDVFERLAKAFSPARPAAAILAAVKLAESVDENTRREYATQAESEVASGYSERAFERFNANRAKAS